MTMKPWRAHDSLYWFTILGLGLATFSALMAIATVAAAISPQKILMFIQNAPVAAETPSSGVLEIALADQLCATDDNCTTVPTRCDACECGAPVNKINVQQYQGQHVAMCANFEGPFCKYNCTTPYVRCIARRCTLTETPPVTPRSSN